MIIKALKQLFSSVQYWIIAVSITVNVLFLYYVIFRQTTTFAVFWESNTIFYNWAQIILTIIHSLLIGVATAMLVYLKSAKKNFLRHLTNASGSFIFGLAATGCTVCGAFLLPILGIAASLTALPLGGLEIKLLAILLVLYALYELTKIMLGLCKPPKTKLISLTRSHIHFNITKKTFPQLVPFIVLSIFIAIIYSLTRLPSSWKINFSRTDNPASSTTAVTGDALLAEINPAQGYEINAVYGDLGPRMIQAGIIDLDKFKELYERSGSPLTAEQMAILTEGSNQKIRIAPQSSYFLLNFFWAAGLANQNNILTEGEMVKYGDGQVGNFASIGGWTLAQGNTMDYYAQSALIPLTTQQQKLVEEVSGNIYRPCCNNPTSFPDCNHGMALLGILELMAASGATQQEMYEGAKYFNAYWFPQSYYDLALYFKHKENKNFAEIDAKTLLSKDFSSVSGWQNTKNWLIQNKILDEAPKGGGGCGV